jgi:hypothetical protein
MKPKDDYPGLTPEQAAAAKKYREHQDRYEAEEAKRRPANSGNWPRTINRLNAGVR